jgi:hypothetical protein
LILIIHHHRLLHFKLLDEVSSLLNIHGLQILSNHGSVSGVHKPEDAIDAVFLAFSTILALSLDHLQ